MHFIALTVLCTYIYILLNFNVYDNKVNLHLDLGLRKLPFSTLSLQPILSLVGAFVQNIVFGLGPW